MGVSVVDNQVCLDQPSPVLVFPLPPCFRMQKQGITLSQRQVEAFVTPSLLSAGGCIDYVTFASLARPRAPFGVTTPQYIRTVDYSSDGVPGPTTMHFQARLGRGKVGWGRKGGGGAGARAHGC